MYHCGVSQFWGIMTWSPMGKKINHSLWPSVTAEGTKTRSVVVLGLNVVCCQGDENTHTYTKQKKEAYNPYFYLKKKGGGVYLLVQPGTYWIMIKTKQQQQFSWLVGALSPVNHRGLHQGCNNNKNNNNNKQQWVAVAVCRLAVQTDRSCWTLVTHSTAGFLMLFIAMFSSSYFIEICNFVVFLFCFFLSRRKTRGCATRCEFNHTTKSQGFCVRFHSIV